MAPRALAGCVRGRLTRNCGAEASCIGGLPRSDRLRAAEAQKDDLVLEHATEKVGRLCPGAPAGAGLD